MSTIKLPFEVLGFSVHPGKQDPTKSYTKLEGMVNLPNGSRTYCEAWLNRRGQFQPGAHVLELEIAVGRDRRIAIFPRDCTPAPSKVAA